MNEQLRKQILALQEWRLERSRRWKETEAKEQVIEAQVPGWSLWWIGDREVYVLVPDPEEEEEGASDE